MTFKAFLLGALTATSLPLYSIAQETAESGDADSASNVRTLGTVTVTSKQREQNLQDVPLSITVFNADDLDGLGVADVRDLANFTPNFNVYSGDGRQNASGINVRGLSPNTSDERYQPVSFFVDGIFMGGISVGLQTIDVERVEVLIGPQSTTFGRATYAGAVDFVTTTPSLDEFGGRFTTELSSHDGGFNYDIKGYVEGPIIADKVSGSLFVQTSRLDGFEQAPGSEFDEVGQEETSAINGVIYAQLTPQTSLKLRGIYAKENDQEALYHTTQPVYWAAAGSNLITLDNGSFWIQGDVPDPIREGIRGVDIGNPLASPNEGGYDRNRYFASAILQHDFDSGIEFSYRGNYLFNSYDGNVDFRGRTLVGTDPVFGPTQPINSDESSFNFRFPFAFQEEFEETSHQIRFVSADDQRLRWSAGAYYYWSEDRNYRETRTSRANPNPQNPDFLTRGPERIINTAVFGSLIYDLTDQFTASFEGRYQTESVEFDRQLGAISSASIPATDLSEENNDFAPRVTLEYSPNEDHLIYALYAEGTKSGRFNNSAATNFFFADPEELTNYEIGSKSTLFNGRAILNLAAFYQEVENQQFRYNFETSDGMGGTEFITAIANIGASEIQGFEIQGQALLTENLSISGGIGYADHEYVDDIPVVTDAALVRASTGAAPGSESYKGLTTALTPKWSGTGSAIYERPVFGGEYDWTLRGDLVYNGERFAEIANLAVIPGYYLFNTRTTLSNDRWNVSLFVNNVFDDETALGSAGNNSSTCEFERGNAAAPYVQGQRCLYLQPQRGREIGVSATVNF